MWRAAFIEDALDLHLATKPMFRPFLLRLLDTPRVADKFDAYTVDGQQRRKELEVRLRKRDGHLPRRVGEELLTELPELLGLTAAQQKDLQALGAKLGDESVFQDLTENDARRVALIVAGASVLQNQACAVAAPVVMARATQTSAEDFWDNETAARQALDSAAMVLRNL
jgi:hypothetical protein